MYAKSEDKILVQKALTSLHKKETE